LQAVEGKDPQAQYALGLKYLKGDGYEGDPFLGGYLIQKAAEQGVIDALFISAGLWRQGLGLPQNFSESIRQYQRAAEQRSRSRQYELALCFTDGKLVGKELSQAAKWFEEAAKQGHNRSPVFHGSCLR